MRPIKATLKGSKQERMFFTLLRIQNETKRMIHVRCFIIMLQIYVIIYQTQIICYTSISVYYYFRVYVSLNILSSNRVFIVKTKVKL